jgi:hypothetical protein
MIIGTATRARHGKLLATALVSVVALSTLLVTTAGAATRAAATKCADPSGTVKVGLSYFGGVESNLNDIGATDASKLTPSSKAIIDGYKAGIAALNSAGGLAGCQVAPVIFNFSAASPDFNQESQQECAAFTQDNKVIAVFTAAYETKVAVDCYAKAKTPLFAFGGSYPPTCVDQVKYAGYIYEPDGLATCNFGPFIGIWNKAGLFPKGAKVGMLVYDDGSGQGQALAKLWTAGLKKLKIAVEPPFVYPAATSGSAFAATNAALANAILKFKTDGVNVVLFTPSASQGTAAFLPQAGAQGFFPNYGLDTADGLGIADTLGRPGLANAKKVIGISYAIIDLPLTAQQALPTNSAITKCATWSAPSTTTLTGSNAFCDFLSVLQAGFANATKTDAKSLKTGIDALGTSWKSSVTYGGAAKLSKNHYDGVSVVQVLTYDPTTKTFTMASPNQKAIAVK